MQKGQSARRRTKGRCQEYKKHFKSILARGGVALDGAHIVSYGLSVLKVGKRPHAEEKPPQ